MESNQRSPREVYGDGDRELVAQPLHRVAYFCKLSLAEVENMKMKRVYRAYRSICIQLSAYTYTAIF